MALMQIRSAENDDVESIVQILRASREQYLPYARSPHSVDGDRRFWKRKIALPDEVIVIARLSEEDVGVLATSQSDGYGWIDQLYLKPGFVRQGMGSLLLKHALEVLPRPIRLWTFQENDRAIGFYQHNGFKDIKRTNGENNEEKCPDILFELT